MIELTQEDFRPLADFRLRWRWTNSKWDLLPETKLAQIHPLVERKAEVIWGHAIAYIEELWKHALDTTSGPITSSSLLAWLQHVDVTKESFDQVRQHLRSFEPQGDQGVIAMWDPTTAVALPWQLFCEYWDDFYYPGSDDVSVWPVAETWCLLYHHEGQLIFGRLKSQEDLLESLWELRQGRLSPDEIAKAMVAFGKMHLREALPDLEHLLMHDNPALRRGALHVLTFEWHLSEHVPTALQMLIRDPDVANRIEAAKAVGFLKANTQDMATLKALAEVVHNEQQAPLVRQYAYRAMKAILHSDRIEQLQLMRNPLDMTREVDWKLVEAYL